MRADYLDPAIRGILLKEYNTPRTYAQKIEKIIKELIIENRS